MAQHMNVPLWGQNAIVRFDEVLYILLNCFFVSISFASHVPLGSCF